MMMNVWKKHGVLSWKAVEEEEDQSWIGKE